MAANDVKRRGHGDCSDSTEDDDDDDGAHDGRWASRLSQQNAAEPQALLWRSLRPRYD